MKLLQFEEGKLKSYIYCRSFAQLHFSLDRVNHCNVWLKTLQIKLHQPKLYFKVEVESTIVGFYKNLILMEVKNIRAALLYLKFSYSLTN